MSEQRRRAKLNDIARIAESLREPVETPDFTSSILARVNAQKPFVPATTRRWMPLARCCAAGLGLAGVFAMTLIIFVKPDLPEKLGSAPTSVTTNLFQSAETEVVRNVAGVRATVANLNRAADTRALLEIRAVAVPEKPGTITIAAETFGRVDPVTYPLASTTPQQKDSFSTHAAVRPAANVMFASDIPAPPAPPASVISEYAAITRMTFNDMRYGAEDARTGLPWQRAVSMTQSWSVRPAAYFTTYPTSPASARPGLNHQSPTLVKELFPIITGQPAGDELQIR